MWLEEFYIEEVRVICGLGKYCFVFGYDYYYVDFIKWNCWSFERQSQYVNFFCEFVFKLYDLYKKFSLVGYKILLKFNKRRVELLEFEIFVDCIFDVNLQVKKIVVFFLCLLKVGRSLQWQVRLMNNDYNVYLCERLKVLQFLLLLY